MLPEQGAAISVVSTLKVLGIEWGVFTRIIQFHHGHVYIRCQGNQKISINRINYDSVQNKWSVFMRNYSIILIDYFVLKNGITSQKYIPLLLLWSHYLFVVYWDLWEQPVRGKGTFNTIMGKIHLILRLWSVICSSKWSHCS